LIAELQGEPNAGRLVAKQRAGLSGFGFFIYSVCLVLFEKDALGYFLLKRRATGRDRYHGLTSFFPQDEICRFAMHRTTHGLCLFSRLCQYLRRGHAIHPREKSTQIETGLLYGSVVHNRLHKHFIRFVFANYCGFGVVVFLAHCMSCSAL